MEFQKASLELKKEIEIKKLEVKELLREDPVDLEKIRAKWEEIAQLQVELKVKALENQQKVKEVLTPEQLENVLWVFPDLDSGKKLDKIFREFP